jgi:carboxymethylenebutenolidase
MLAGNGFVVAVPEIYHEFEPLGTVFNYDTAGTERGNELKMTKTIQAYDDDARAVLKFLENYEFCNGKLGAMGICIGGHLAFRAAMNSNVLATACFYATDIHKRSLGKGMNDNSLDRVGEIQGELCMFWGRQDPHVPLDGRLKIHAALEAANVFFQWHEVNGAHAFIRDEGARYNPVLAQQCYGILLEMFKRRLHDGDIIEKKITSTETRH